MAEAVAVLMQQQQLLPTVVAFLEMVVAVVAMVQLMATGNVAELVQADTVVEVLKVLRPAVLQHLQAQVLVHRVATIQVLTVYLQAVVLAYTVVAQMA